MAKTYNPKKVQLAIGPHIVTGYADGTFIQVDRNADQFAVVVGADGEAARSASADKSGTVTVTLMQTSASNDFLSLALSTDEQTNLNTMPLLLKDISGRTLVQAAEGWVKKYATIELGKEIVSREWVFETGELLITEGGN
jgi:hypothetical protein